MSPAQNAPPPFVIDSEDHGGIILVTVAMLMVFVVLFLGIRIYMRFDVGGRWDNDDSVLVVATIVTVAQSIFKMVELSWGLGKSIKLVDATNVSRIAKSEYATDILYIFVICLSKCSAVLFFIRLTPDKKHNLVCKAILGAAIVWGVVSILIISIRCQLTQPWVITSSCADDLSTRWLAITILDLVLELALFGMAVFLVMGLHTAARLKSFVVLAFSFRLPLIAFMFLRYIWLRQYIFSNNSTFDAVPMTIWTQVQIDYAVVACTIPCLRPFMTACNTGFDEGIISTNGQIDSYRLSYLRRKHWKISGNVDSSNQLSKHDPLVRQDTFRGDNVDNSTTAVTNPDGLRDAGSMASDDSKRMIIRREVGWQVAVESSRPASTRVS